MTETTRTTTLPAASTRRGELLALAVLATGLIAFGLAAPAHYQLYLMIHIFAATVWVGGGATIALLAFLIERENNPILLARFADRAQQVGIRVYLPASLVLLVFGLVLVSKGGWGYGHFWVIFGLVGWAATASSGLLYLGPQAKKLAQVATERGLEDAETQKQARKVIVADRWQVLLLLLVVADMAAKPFA